MSQYEGFFTSALADSLANTGIHIRIIDSPDGSTSSIINRVDGANDAYENAMTSLAQLDIPAARERLRTYVEDGGMADLERDAIMAPQIPHIASFAYEQGTSMAIVHGIRHRVMERVTGATSIDRNTEQVDGLQFGYPADFRQAMRAHQTAEPPDVVTREINRGILTRYLFPLARVSLNVANEITSAMNDEQIANSIAILEAIADDPELTFDAKAYYRDHLKELVQQHYPHMLPQDSPDNRQ